MKVYDYHNYTLLLSYDPCQIFEYVGLDEFHGLNLVDCKLHSNNLESAYIAGWCNLHPITNKPYLFLNLSRRQKDDIQLMGLVMHEMMHLFSLLNHYNFQEKEEEIINSAEQESYKVVKIIKSILS